MICFDYRYLKILAKITCFILQLFVTLPKITGLTLFFVKYTWRHQFTLTFLPCNTCNSVNDIDILDIKLFFWDLRDQHSLLQSKKEKSKKKTFEFGCELNARYNWILSLFLNQS